MTSLPYSTIRLRRDLAVGTHQRICNRSPDFKKPQPPGCVPAMRRSYIDKGDSSYADEASFVTKRVNNFHIGYFLSIAVLEVVNAGFLILKFRKDNVTKSFASADLYKNIAKSSENRLIFLCVIGILRSVTYSFQQQAQSASKGISELDRFAYALTTLYPYVLLIDYLITKATATGIKSDSRRTNASLSVTGRNEVQSTRPLKGALMATNMEEGCED